MQGLRFCSFTLAATRDPRIGFDSACLPVTGVDSLLREMGSGRMGLDFDVRAARCYLAGFARIGFDFDVRAARRYHSGFARIGFESARSHSLLLLIR